MYILLILILVYYIFFKLRITWNIIVFLVRISICDLNQILLRYIISIPFFLLEILLIITYIIYINLF